jgi:DNA-directed RNA polymerase specialized sigma24 family protein
MSWALGRLTTSTSGMRRAALAPSRRELADAREELTRRLAEVRDEVDETARGLIAEGVSVRDVADLLGISAGRVSQLVRRSRHSA